MSKNKKGNKKAETKKECKKCGKLLPLDSFPTDNKAKDKKWRFCRKCESERKKLARQNSKTTIPKTVAKKTKQSLVTLKEIDEGNTQEDVDLKLDTDGFGKPLKPVA